MYRIQLEIAGAVARCCELVYGKWSFCEIEYTEFQIGMVFQAGGVVAVPSCADVPFQCALSGLDPV